MKLDVCRNAAHVHAQEQDWHRRSRQAQDRRRPMQPARRAIERRRQPRRFRAATIAYVPSAGNGADQWWGRFVGRQSRLAVPVSWASIWFAEQNVLKLRFGREILY